jgi:cytochrome P450 PksS
LGSLSFNPISLDYTANPKPYFAEYHRERPLFHDETFNTWVAHGYEEVRGFLGHPDMGTRVELMEGFEEESARRLERWPVTEGARRESGFGEPEKHARMRRILGVDLKPSMVRKMAATVEDVVAKHCAPLQSEREVDVVKLVAGVPLTTISRVLGVDESSAESEVFLASAPAFFRGMNPLATDELHDDAEAAAGKMLAVMQSIVEERLRRPQEDMISQVLEAAKDVEDISVKELTHIFVILLAAGTDTTRLSTSLAVRTLLDHPDHLEALRADPSRVDGAILELLRYESPTKFLSRIASEDVSWKGQTIPRGSHVLLSIFGAGWDEKVVERPERLDFERDSRINMSFGYGAHYCMGVHLARLQLGAMLRFFLAHMPKGTTYDPDGIEWDPANLFLREITRMPLRLR